MSRADLTLYLQSQKLARCLERLKSYTPEDLERDIKAFAQSEVEIEDPLQARRVEPSQLR
jgi:hypothetical protein